MELELSRVDYTIVGITSSNCLKLLPSSNLPKEPQKVAVVDNDGILQIFTVKKEDIHLQFKTLPGPTIKSLQLGGSIGGEHDKIFVASEREVRGYTKKGKLFLTFDSGMTETIESMFVLGNDLFVCGKHIYNHFRDCKEVGSYLCGDRIVDVIAFYADKTKRLMSLIACEGRMIRALEHARVTLSMEVDSAPTLLHVYQHEDTTKIILFATVDGRVGVLDLENKMAFDRWLVDNSNNSSTISCLDSYDMTGNGTRNLIVGRQDGSIEIYIVNPTDPADSAISIFLHVIHHTRYSLPGEQMEAKLHLFSRLDRYGNCNESVTSLQCGIVGSSGHNEVLVATYTGRIFGLTTEILDKNVGGDSNTGSYIFSHNTSQKITKLKNEIDDLLVKVGKEREKYQNSTQSFFEELSAIPLLSIKDSFVLNKMTATYNLNMEVATAIDNVLLQSNVPVDLLDVEKNSAVVSYSDAKQSNGNFVLATYRCQINTNRLEIKIRTIEGQHGTLQTYITPLVQPKCSRLKQYVIKPLSLHFRVHTFEENRPFNKLVIKGGFSLAEIHTWLMQCLPEVPEKPQYTNGQNNNTILYFQSTFLGTILKCTYAKGEGYFKSDNISTISILKDVLTDEATKKKIKLDINSTVNGDSIDHVLNLLETKLSDGKALCEEKKLLDALNELEISEDDTVNYLSIKYRDLLIREKEIREKYHSQPDYLDRIHGVIGDLYVDLNKFKGNNVTSKLPKLLQVLERGSMADLLSFFSP